MVFNPDATMVQQNPEQFSAEFREWADELPCHQVMDLWTATVHTSSSIHDWSARSATNYWLTYVPASGTSTIKISRSAADVIEHKVNASKDTQQWPS
jgi:hypothetical protein